MKTFCLLYRSGSMLKAAARVGDPLRKGPAALKITE